MIHGTIQIPRMPDLWQMEKLHVSHKAISGALAHWAVYQSPYTVPENLGAAVEEFMSQWPREDFLQMSSAELHDAILHTFARCPLILAWNERKNGREGMGFISLYDKPSPDDDFIDLDALARNVTQELVLWEQVNAAHDETASRVA